MPIPAFPTTPADVPSLATVYELFDAYHRHLMAAVAGRPGAVAGLRPATARRSPADELDRHAVAALAIGQAIVDTFAQERWPLVHDVLAAGGTADEAGAALGGLEPDEIAAGLVSWAGRAHRAGVLTVDEVDAVLELVAGGAR